jgi:hypothetical protein
MMTTWERKATQTQEVNGRLKREKAMASILIRRDEFNITPQGIVHKPTDSHFAPHANDPYSGSIRIGQVGNVVPVGERYDSVQLKKMMMQLWTEYVAEKLNLFRNKAHGQVH